MPMMFPKFDAAIGIFGLDVLVSSIKTYHPCSGTVPNQSSLRGADFQR